MIETLFIVLQTTCIILWFVILLFFIKTTPEYDGEFYQGILCWVFPVIWEGSYYIANL